MQNLIQDYEMTRRGLLDRIHTINAQLRKSSLQTCERETLERRREILTAESIDVMHIIIDLREHL